jgi:VIT1/CCC1 family predicted Fe2+/Mn2+ transporter
MAHDALGAHARDELGITDTLSAKPLQAALASACSFASGALLPLLVALLCPTNNLIPFVAVSALFFLAILGGLAAKAGGADIAKGVMRITFWSALAMGVTAGIGAVFGTLA